MMEPLTYFVAQYSETITAIKQLSMRLLHVPTGSLPHLFKINCCLKGILFRLHVSALPIDVLLEALWLTSLHFYKFQSGHLCYSFNSGVLYRAHYRSKSDRWYDQALTYRSLTLDFSFSFYLFGSFFKSLSLFLPITLSCLIWG